MPNILTRFADVMSANLNSLLTNAEAKNADKLLEKYVADAKRDLDQLKAETAAVIAEEMAAARKLADCEGEISKYTGYAEAAVKAGNDDDARKFLTYKQQAAAKLEALQSAYQLAKENSEKMRQMSQKLANDIAAATSRLDELKAKLNVAKNQERMQQMGSRLGSAGSSLSQTDSLFDAVQKRIDAIDAKAALEQDLDPDHERKELEAKYNPTAQAQANDIEDELARLKAGLK